MKKVTKCFVGLALSLLVTFSSTIPSLATTVITREEIESNDAIGDENICSVGEHYIGYINVPEDIDRFMIFPNKTQTIHFSLIKNYSNSDQILYIYVYDHMTGQYVKPLFALEENSVQFTFQPERGHVYTLLVNSDTVSLSPYVFSFQYVQ